MVQPNGEGMVMIRDEVDARGGPLLSEIGKQPQLQRRISKISSSSSTTSDMDAHSLVSGQDSLGSMLSDSGSVSSSGDAARGSFTSVDAEGSSSGTNKRPLGDEEELRLVEQEQQQSSGQQLRKACDLCTKVGARQGLRPLVGHAPCYAVVVVVARVLTSGERKTGTLPIPTKRGTVRGLLRWRV